MKIQLKTIQLQEMVSRSIKGASNNKMIPITQLMALELKKNVFTLITTDATNYLYIRQGKVEGDDFYVTVPVDVFSRLISRMTCEFISLDSSSGNLEVTGNGTYTIELPIDENGNAIRYPDPLASLSEVPNVSKQINRSTVQVILNSLKSALAPTLEIPCYTGYYVGDCVVATDTYKIANFDKVLLDEPRLISSDMMDLFAVMSVDTFTLDIYGNTVVASSPDCVVYGTFMDGVDEFAIDAISGLVNMEFDSMCKIPKSAIMRVLDRLSLFVNPYDKNGIYLTFTNNSLQISSKSSSGVESIDYMEVKNPKDFTCCIDIEMLVSQIKAQEVDLVEIWYGEDNAIKMVDGNITQVVALLEDDRVD